MKSIRQNLNEPKASAAISKLLTRINKYHEELHELVVSDIKYRIRERITVGYLLAKEIGVHKSELSHVLSRRRKFTEEKIKSYTQWLRKRGF